jgi:hypothetical protein
VLVNVLIGVAVVLAVFVVVAATRPAAYRVERKVEVAAPAERLFGVFNDLRQFSGVWVLFGEAFDTRNPQKTFEGAATGVGQSMVWSGKDVGAGKLTIHESVPGQKVGMKLEFVKPMASTATVALTLAGTPAGASVTWTMDGNHNFLGRAFGLFMNMDNALGGDIEKALAQLKTAAESKQA